MVYWLQQVCICCLIYSMLMIGILISWFILVCIHIDICYKFVNYIWHKWIIFAIKLKMYLWILPNFPTNNQIISILDNTFRSDFIFFSNSHFSWVSGIQLKMFKSKSDISWILPYWIILMYNFSFFLINYSQLLVVLSHPYCCLSFLEKQEFGTTSKKFTKYVIS